MFRKIMIAVVFSLALMAPLAIPAVSQAREANRSYHSRQVHNRGSYRAHRSYRGHTRAYHSYSRGYHGHVR